jgi:transcriptional regulator with XRE-family HTH domain
MELRRSFGKTLRLLRERRNLSQEDLASLCNVHRTYIGRIERGETNVTLETIAKISRALNIRLFQLFKGLDE